jgi:hypothetical protein
MKVSTRRRALAFLLMGFGTLITVGAIAEILNLLIPALIPQIQDLPLMRIHRDHWFVHFWTLASNVVNATLGIGFVAAGWGVKHRATWPLRLTERAAIATVFIAGGGALVCTQFLYPILAPDLSAADEKVRTTTLVMLVSMLGAALLLPILPLLCVRWLRRLERGERAVSAT